MSLGPDYDRDREGARAVPGEGSGDPHHGTAQAPAHIAENVRRCAFCGAEDDGPYRWSEATQQWFCEDGDDRD